MAQENCVKSKKKTKKRDRKSQLYLSKHSSSVGIKVMVLCISPSAVTFIHLLLRFSVVSFIFPLFVCWRCCYFHLLLQFRSDSFILCKSFHYALADFGVRGLLQYDSLMCFFFLRPVPFCCLIDIILRSSANIVVGDLCSGAWNIVERNK